MALEIVTGGRPIWKDLPQLSLAERDRRWKKIREKMILAGIDCLLTWGSSGAWNTAAANMRYVTHLAAAGVALFPQEGDPVVWTGLSHTTDYRTATQTWVKDVRPMGPIQAVIHTAKEQGFERSRIGVVGFSNPMARNVPELVPYRAFATFKEALPGAELVNGSWILEELRMIKSPEEIEFLERSARLAELMFQAMVDSARPGVKECEVYANMLRALVANGGEEAMILMDSGSPPLLHGRWPPPTQRPLEKGDIIIVEYHSNYAGYMAAVEHSVSLGEPSQEFREIHQVSQEVFARGTAKMWPGTPFGEVIEAFRAPVQEAGMAYVECGIHGHGLSSCEFPSCVYSKEWGEHGLAQVPAVELAEGMVFGTNIDIHNPRWSKATGLMLGDTILVTREGPRKLTSIPLEFTVV